MAKACLCIRRMIFYDFEKRPRSNSILMTHRVFMFSQARLQHTCPECRNPIEIETGKTFVRAMAPKSLSPINSSSSSVQFWRPWATEVKLFGKDPFHVCFVAPWVSVNENWKLGSCVVNQWPAISVERLCVKLRQGVENGASVQPPNELHKVGKLLTLSQNNLCSVRSFF